MSQVECVNQGPSKEQMAGSNGVIEKQLKKLLFTRSRQV